MKPTLPCTFFDLCLIPRHDLRPGRDYTDTGIFPTHGALHPMRPDPSIPKDITLILIGGPSKDFDWDDEAMLNQLSDISINTPGNIVLTTSRRTPTGFAEKIQTAVPEITVVPVEETQPGWVARHLAHASATWVSQDSVSMVYEALGAGAPVGVLAVPRRHGNRKSPHPVRPGNAGKGRLGHRIPGLEKAGLPPGSARSPPSGGGPRRRLHPHQILSPTPRFMKIVHLVPSMESGGVEQVVMELGSGLSARGVENIVVSGGGRLIPRLEKEGSRPPS